MSEYMSKEQFYKMAHIRKDTARRLIQENLIPAIDTGKATKRYLIRFSDAEFYLKDRVINPQKYNLTNGSKTQCFPLPYKKPEAKKLRNAAIVAFQDAPELLSADDVSDLLGYRRKTIYEWSRKGWLMRLKSGSQILFPKKGVVAFVGSKEFHNLRMKSDKHLALIRSAQNE